MKSLADWLAHAEGLHDKNIDLSLDRVRLVADRMRLAFGCPVITVAGTNGKGSTCAMLESILKSAGYRTGVFSSPYFVDLEEELRLSGIAVEQSILLLHFQAVERARDDTPLTLFEFTTLAVLSCLTTMPIDVAILEVGMGGRLDVVNIIDADCAVLTCIDLDHMVFLGADREAIGREKAGIMRAKRPVIVSDPQPPNSILDHAIEIGADIRLMGQDFLIKNSPLTWDWTGRSSQYLGLLLPALQGPHQITNASGALAALEALRWRLPVTERDVRNGLQDVQLPGRFQVIQTEPTVVLDVAHNPHAIVALVSNLKLMKNYTATYAVFGAMVDKDLDAMLSLIGPLIDHWYLADLPTPRAALAVDLKTRLESMSNTLPSSASTHSGPLEAFRLAMLRADPKDRIVVFGSFLTVGAILAKGVSINR